jgi:hypothetical protein
MTQPLSNENENPTRLLFRSESGRTELSTGPTGIKIHVLTGVDTINEEEVTRLIVALKIAFGINKIG